MGAPYGEGSANFEAMREWNRPRSIARRSRILADQLMGR